METESLASQNPEHGFWGTTSLDYEEDETQKRWDIAFETLALLSGKPSEEIREFLDSIMGRHIADDCFDKDVKQVIMRNYYAWYEAHLFGDSGKYIAEKIKVRLERKFLIRLQEKRIYYFTPSKILIAFIKTMQCALIGMKRFIISDYNTLTNLYHAIIKSNLFTFCQLIYNKKRITIFSQYYYIFNICINCHSRFGCRF